MATAVIDIVRSAIRLHWTDRFTVAASKSNGTRFDKPLATFTARTSTALRINGIDRHRSVAAFDQVVSSVDGDAIELLFQSRWPIEFEANIIGV